MKFRIIRTSIYNNNVKPIDIDDVILYREDNGEQFWYIEIKSINDLCDFIKKAGEEIIICLPPYSVEKEATIEIYDTYRE